MRFSDPEKDEMAAPPQRFSRRGWLIGSGVSLLLAGLGAAAWLIHRLAGDRALQKAFAMADAQDPNWRLEDIEATRAAIPDNQNGALIVRAVNRLLPDNWEQDPVPESPAAGTRPTLHERIVDHPAEVRLRRDQVEALTKSLETYEPALLRARTLVNYPKGRIAVAWAKDGITTPLPDTQNTRKVFQLLSYDAMLRAEEGNLTGAFTACQAVLNASRTIGDEPTLVSQLVRIAGRSVALGKIERTLAQGQLADEPLARMQNLLADEADEPLLYYGVRGERATAHRAMTALESGDLSLKMFEGLSKGPGSGLGGNLDEVLAYFSMKSSHAYVINYLTECVEMLNRPDPDIEGMRAKGRTVRLDAPFVAKMLIPAFDKVAEACQRSQAQLRSATAALAAERFRMRHGRWPAALSELTPDLLPEIPRDPFDKQPLRMTRFNQGIVIYSVGPDGEDNGGLLRASNPGVKQNFDVGFRLWDVHQRRQTAREVLSAMPHEAP